MRPVYRWLGKLTFGSRLACALLALRGALPRPGPGGHGWVGPRLVKDVADLGGFKGVGLAAVLSLARPAALRFKAGWLGGGVVRGPVFLWPVRGRPAGWRPVRRGGGRHLVLGVVLLTSKVQGKPALLRLGRPTWG